MAQKSGAARVLLMWLILGWGLAWATLAAQAGEPLSGPAILQQLESFREMGSVLYVAAHPDDENTLLIAYLARGRNYRTAYLSATRGDGGQNVLGPEFGQELGVARTQELLAARRLDGGRQFFTRAIDFGFSKDYKETLSIWDHHQVVADMVRVIRTFRPDVVITRFSVQPGGTHGHHTASAVLALEAFRLAGKPTAFPDQLGTLSPWQPKRIFVNGRGDAGGANSLSMEIAGSDPVTGIPFGELAGRSRSMHKTQGFGNFSGGGGARNRAENFQLLDGEFTTNDIMDGVDTSWNRIAGGADIGTAVSIIIKNFNTQDPAASLPGLLKLHSQLAALHSSDPLVAEKRGQLDMIVASCLGLSVSTTVDQAEVVPGEAMSLHYKVTEKSSVPVRWQSVRLPLLHSEFGPGRSGNLVPNETADDNQPATLPSGTPLSQPYWLRTEGTAGMFAVADAALIGQPENPPVFPIEHIFEVGGQTLVIPDEPIQITSDLRPEHVRRLQAIPPVSIHFTTMVGIFKRGENRPVAVELTTHRKDTTGTLQLAVPSGWKVEPKLQAFSLATLGERKKLQFVVTAPAIETVGKIRASATIGGAIYQNDRVEINYRHIPFQLLQPVASLQAVCLDLKTRGHNIGYLPGAGDSVAEGLIQMGYAVTLLTDADLNPQTLHNLDAVVIGVRAFNVRTNLNAQLPALCDYVQAGGTVVAQYNRPDGLKTDRLSPFNLKIANLRVTDETAAVTFLFPEHPVLNTPNKITQDDFAGWVQERGIYFPGEWATNFTPILACHDAGEEPLRGSLLVAKYGQGYFVYTGLVFFRQLPAGVPGAYRLFANLVSLGK